MILRDTNKPNTLFRSVKPGVVLQPRSWQQFQKGMTVIVNAIRPTLGPLPRLVAISRTHRDDIPELLDDGGLIARRIVALPDRDADMGAMFIRHILWNLREEVGDGTATAAVLLKSIYDEGLKFVLAGGNAIRLRYALEALLPCLLDQISYLSQPIRDAQMLRDFARSICPDIEIADLLSEIHQIIGQDGYVEIEKARSQDSEREYIEGAFWEGALVHPNMISDTRNLAANLENAAILITDLEIKSAQMLVPVFRVCMESGYKNLAIIARQFSDDAIALVINSARSMGLVSIGVKTPGIGLTDQFVNLQDIAILSGGRVLLSATGESLEYLSAGDLGHARRFWANHKRFGLVGGKGDPLQLRKQIAKLKAALDTGDSSEACHKLRARVGRLYGGAARLFVGGKTESEQINRLEQAKRASRIIRTALREGVIPGGGTALLICCDFLESSYSSAKNEEDQVANRILQKALIQPAFIIAANAGYKLPSLSPGLGFNALTGQPTDMLIAGVLDATGVLKAALTTAITGAALALTIDVLVHCANPQYSTEP